MNIGARLKQARIEAGLSQEQAGKVAGVSKQSISLIESGRTADPKVSTLEPLARRLGVSIQWLMTGKGQPRSDSSSSGNSTVTESSQLAGLASQAGGLNAEILLEAERWALLFERAEGLKYSGLQRMTKVSEVYGDILADGGKLSDARHEEYLQRMDESLDRRTGGSNERSEGHTGGPAAARRHAR